MAEAVFNPVLSAGYGPMNSSISIITVTFNAAGDLPGLVESLRAQSDRDFEWVVIDGASTDATVDIIEAAGDVVSRWISEPDCGIYDAMNKAVALASGQYYLICGADDLLFPNAVADYRRIASETNADIISACVESDAGVVRPLRGLPWWRGQSAFVSHHSVGTLIKRSLHQEFGYYSRRFPIAADHYFLKRVCTTPNSKMAAADFLAGHYSTGGISGSDIPGTLADFFRVQLETERFSSLQMLFHAMRLVRRYRSIIAYVKSRRAGTP
jgi:glycosyltransferase involved in cell wall biosynthesis